MLNCKFLSEYKPIQFSSNGKLAAVSLIICNSNDDPYVILTKRSEYLKKHPGEISLPGGGYEQIDKTLLNTCFRETHEELNIQLSEENLVTKLDDLITVTNFHVRPFVFLYKEKLEHRFSTDEIQEVISFPLAQLQNPDKFKYKEVTFNNQTRTSYYTYYEGHRIWGATASILNNLLQLL